MKKLLILTVAALVCFMVGCKSGGSDDYFPMTVGSQWDYSGYTLYGTTNPPTDTMQTMTSTTIAQAKTTLSNGNEVVPFQSTTVKHILFPIERTDTTSVTGYARESGDVILSYSSTNDTTPDTLMITTLEANKTWYDGSRTALVVGQEDVTVAAGTYKNAWKIKYTTVSGSDTMEMFQWFAKGVGAVKTHYETSESGFYIIYDQGLTSSTIK
jgi:hypothetical protein